MKQVFVMNGKVVVKDVPPPVYGDNEVLVANAYSAISVGTETSAIAGGKLSKVLKVLKDPALRREAINYVKGRGIKESIDVAKDVMGGLNCLGYSSAGTVLKIGANIIDVEVGDRVACAGGGKANHAELVSVPRNLIVKIPDGVDFEDAAFTTLGAIAMQGIRRCGRQFGETLVILGIGLIGQLAVQIAKSAGYRVIAIDKISERVELARKMGADVGLVLGKHDLEKEVFHFTNGVGADAVIICAAASSSEPVNQAIKIVREKGRIVVVGDVGMKIERPVFYEKELDFLISRSYGPGRYDRIYEEEGVDYPIGYVRWTENRNMQAFIDLLKKKRINVKPIIDAIFPVEEAEKAYELVVKSKRKPIGVLLKYDLSKYLGAKAEIPSKKVIKTTSRAVDGKINVAVIGVGSFAKSILMPLILKIPDYNLRAIVTASGDHAEQVASKFRPEYYTTDYKRVLEDENVDLVIITTRHNLHYQMIIDAAKAEKVILVEKPMCLTEEELEEIIDVIDRTKTPLFVGFNRRYAPLAVEAKNLLRQKHGPYLINYRVNAGFLPKTHWVQDPKVGGGRVIGECCHFFDFFNYIIESKVQTVQAVKIPVDNTSVVANDNVVATIKWMDGSLTTLIYTALGHRDLAKERIEFFADGSSIVLDDFKKLELYGFKGFKKNLFGLKQTLKRKRQEKGHYQELLSLVKFLRGEKSEVIPFRDSVEAMRISFEVERLLKSTEKFSFHALK